MRTEAWVALLLLILVLVCGIVDVRITASITSEYTHAAEELMEMTQKEDWQHVADSAVTYRQSWEKRLVWLQMLVDHEAADALTDALHRIQAGADAKDLPTCLVGCHELREAAEHLSHRDAFTLGNIL